MLHRAGLLASGYKRFSPGLPIPFNSGTVAFSGWTRGWAAYQLQ